MIGPILLDKHNVARPCANVTTTSMKPLKAAAKQGWSTTRHYLNANDADDGRLSAGGR